MKTVFFVRLHVTIYWPEAYMPTDMSSFVMLFNYEHGLYLDCFDLHNFTNACNSAC
jgi:hypothetical protein